MKRIGLLGGSFDPVHNAHLALARAARDQLGLEELRWIPAGRPWQKSRRLSAAEHREAMVRLAIEGEPRFVLDPTELRREGETYTLETVQELDAAHPGTQWFLILGQDQHAALHTWRDWRDLLGLVALAVAGRPGAAPAVDPEVARCGHRTLNLPPMDVSATEIRHRAGAGESIADFVPDPVRSYIERHRLYASVEPDPHTRS